MKTFPPTSGSRGSGACDVGDNALHFQRPQYAGQSSREARDFESSEQAAPSSANNGSSGQYAAISPSSALERQSSMDVVMMNIPLNRPPLSPIVGSAAYGDTSEGSTRLFPRRGGPKKKAGPVRLALLVLLCAAAAGCAAYGRIFLHMLDVSERSIGMVSIVGEVDFFEGGSIPSNNAVLPQHAHPGAGTEPTNSSSEEARPYNDATVNVDLERERCARFGWKLDEDRAKRGERRRLFLGGLIADDSWHPLEAVAAEAYGIYEAISFVESDTTQSYFPRRLRFIDGSDDLKRLRKMFGPDTNVTVEFYHDSPVKEENPRDPLVREHMQRAVLNGMWERAGMRPDDVAVVADADETFTRDFLRAAQICNIWVFHPGQDCKVAKLWAAAAVFESAPDCIVQERLWSHPDMMVGECVDRIGNATLHPPAKRVFRDVHGKRAQGYGIGGYDNMPNTTMYPLYDAGDFRNYLLGRRPSQIGGGYKWDDAKKSTNQPVRYTAFHFHNFFDSAKGLRRKYRTYGHPLRDAYERPLADFHEDLNLTVRCVLGISDEGNHDKSGEPIRRVEGGLDAMIGPKPMYFDDKYRRQRWEQLKNILAKDTNIL